MNVSNHRHWLTTNAGKRRNHEPHDPHQSKWHSALKLIVLIVILCLIAPLVA